MIICALPLTRVRGGGYNVSTSDGTLAPSSSGQDRGFSALKPGFDSPWRYAQKGRGSARPLSHPATSLRALTLCRPGPLCAAVAAIITVGLAVQAPARSVTMEEAVRSALTHNADLRAAMHARDAARLEADRDKPVARPKVTLEAETLIQTPELRFPRGVEDATVRHARYSRIALEVVQPLFRFGVHDAWHRHSAMLRAADASLMRERNELIRSVRKAYVRALTAKAMLALAREGLALAERHKALVGRMIEAGLAPSLDALAADADLAEAKDGLVRAENGTRLAVADLCRLTGLPDSTDAASLAAFVPPTDHPAEDELVRQAVAARPELLALRDWIIAASTGASLARSQSLPEISLRASVARQTPAAFVSRDWAAVGLAASWPVMDGGKAASGTRKARAKADELRAQLESAEAGIRLEVRAALGAIGAADARIRLCESRINAARSALAIVELRYEQRATTLLEVAAARLAVTKAVAALVEAQGDKMLAFADLRYAAALDLSGDGGGVR